MLSISFFPLFVSFLHFTSLNNSNLIDQPIRMVIEIDIRAVAFRSGWMTLDWSWLKPPVQTKRCTLHVILISSKP